MEVNSGHKKWYRSVDYSPIDKCLEIKRLNCLAKNKFYSTFAGQNERPALQQAVSNLQPASFNNFSLYPPTAFFFSGLQNPSKLIKI